MSCPSKTIHLISIVVTRRKILYAILYRRVGDSVPMLDARSTEMNVVPRVRFLDTDVMCDAKSKLVCFILDGRHEIPIDAEDFDSVHAHFLQIAYSLSRSFSRGG